MTLRLREDSGGAAVSGPLKKCNAAPCGRRNPAFNVTHEG